MLDKLPHMLNLYNKHKVPIFTCTLCHEIDDQLHCFVRCPAFAAIRHCYNWMNWNSFFLCFNSQERCLCKEFFN